MLATKRTNQDNIQLAFSLEQAAQWLRDNPDLPTMTGLLSCHAFGDEARGVLARFAASLDCHVVERADEDAVRIESDFLGYRLRVSATAPFRDVGGQRATPHYDSILKDCPTCRASGLEGDRYEPDACRDCDGSGRRIEVQP